jgi:DNA-binding beta-propeller fold protein YncE
MARPLRVTPFVIALFCAGCGGGGADPTPPPPDIDLSGVWAGAWQGSDPSLGSVSGTWEVVISQDGRSAAGPSLILGDIDCMDGAMQTTVGSGASSITGNVARAPCGRINWTLTAVNNTTGETAGTWSNAITSGTGSMSGKRIARLNGVRIRSVYPPAGAPNTLVTLSGDSLGAADTLTFNGAPQTTFASSATRVIARVPAAATTGAVQLSAGGQTAGSPRAFSTDVMAPPSTLGNAVLRGTAPAALAVSPDGRKVYLADRDAAASSIFVLRSAGLATLINVFPGGQPRSLAPSPDGRRLYAAVPGKGLLVLDAANLALKQTISVPLDDEGRDNPQGIAVSPDGERVVVSSGTGGGGVSIVRAADGAVVGTFTPGAGLAPMGVAFHPAGTPVYVATVDVGGAAGSLITFDPATASEVGRVAIGVRPIGVAVTPDAQLVFVSNQGSNNVTRYDVASGIALSPTTVGAEPTGIAVSPDGVKVFVVNRVDNSVSVFFAANGVLDTTIPAVGTSPIAVALQPRGTTAYVAATTSHTVQEIGGMRTLTITRGGSGIGTVRSVTPGINCGTVCQAQFPVGTMVSLTATPDSTSQFSSWSGAGCAGTITLSADMTCQATFFANAPPPNTSQPPPPRGGGCFIATAAYGSDMAPEVQLLRQFRDRQLLTHAPGRAFVAFYYRHSPPLAEAIRAHDGARAVVRAVLWPVVLTVKYPAQAALATLLMCLAFSWATRRSARSRAGSSD